MSTVPNKSTNLTSEKDEQQARSDRVPAMLALLAVILLFVFVALLAIFGPPTSGAIDQQHFMLP